MVNSSVVAAKAVTPPRELLTPLRNMKTLLSLGSLCLFASASQAATVVYSENFSSSTLTSNGNPYLGGWFTPQTAFQQWVGDGSSSITTGALRVEPTSGSRSAGVVLSPGIFPAAGSYTLSFDVTAYNTSAGDPAKVTIWSGKDYGASNTGNSLQIDTYNMQLNPQGAASVASLGSATFTAAGSSTQSITFTYDGVSAVALFFGASTDGWPFPTATYDNITVTQNSPVVIPEPSVSALAAGMVGVMCLLRRRNARVAR